MTRLSDPLLHEVFVQWSAWGTLADYLTMPEDRDARVADPGDIHGRACTCDRDRLVALMYAHGHGDSMLEAEEILGEILAMAAEGRRPRYGRELGLTIEDIAA